MGLRTVGVGMTRESRARGTVVALGWGIVDSAIWFVAVVVATWLRFQFEVELTFVSTTFLAAGGAAAAQLILGLTFGPYTRGTHRGSFEEIRSLATTTALVTLTLFGTALAVENLSDELTLLVPGTVPAIGGLTAYSVQLSTRLLFRTHDRRRAARRDDATRVIVVGAGSGGRLLVRNLLHDERSSYLPVALLDDDRLKRRSRIEGLRVRGTRDDMARVADATGAEHVVIAIPSATSQTVRELSSTAEAAGLKPLVVPSLSHVIGRSLTASDIRDVDLADLLGRRPVRLDDSAISDQLNHKVVLVTGAGGSIGAELCRQIARFSPERLVLLDRDESALHAVQLDLDGEGLLQNENIVLADIRDLATLRDRFREHRPDIVFHAAALKHLPLLERFPAEAWQTNVLGTLNVLTAAEEVGVGTFVNISTDKAADPTSVLGYSKRVAERLTAGFAERSAGHYLSVRFGNVLGSRGSVVPAFTAQIRRGGPVTITHPDVRRYFMLIPEACQLVMQAATMDVAGDVLVLDMGEQVKIIDLARTLISMSDHPDVEISFTGLRPGEKLAEDLFGASDDHRLTGHELITATDVPPLPASVVHTADPGADETHGTLSRLALAPRSPQSGSTPGSRTLRMASSTSV